MKAIVVFLAKQKNYGRVLIMQQGPPNSGGQAISEASLLRRRGRIMAVSHLGSSSMAKVLEDWILESKLMVKVDSWRLC